VLTEEEVISDEKESRPQQSEHIGHLTTIKEYNESQENGITSSPTKHLEFLSLRYDEPLIQNDSEDYELSPQKISYPKIEPEVKN